MLWDPCRLRPMPETVTESVWAQYRQLPGIGKFQELPEHFYYTAKFESSWVEIHTKVGSLSQRNGLAMSEAKSPTSQYISALFRTPNKLL